MIGPWSYVVLVLALVLTSRVEAPGHAQDAQRGEYRALGAAAAVHASKRVDAAHADARKQTRSSKAAAPSRRFVLADPDRAGLIVETARIADRRGVAARIRLGARAPPEA